MTLNFLQIFPQTLDISGWMGYNKGDDSNTPEMKTYWLKGRKKKKNSQFFNSNTPEIKTYWLKGEKK